MTGCSLTHELALALGSLLLGDNERDERPDSQVCSCEAQDEDGGDLQVRGRS